MKKNIIILPMFALFYILACKKRPAEIGQIAKPTASQRQPVEADFSTLPYEPVGDGFGSFLIERSDLNHNNSGAQGVLLEIQKNSLHLDDGQPSGYHFFLYNPQIHTSTDGSTQCDLQKLTKDGDGNSYKILMMTASGEGFIKDDEISPQDDQYTSIYPANGCDFIITGVHTDGEAIPEDVWTRADKLWNQDKAKEATPADRTQDSEPSTSSDAATTDSQRNDAVN